MTFTAHVIFIVVNSILVSASENVYINNQTAFTSTLAPIPLTHSTTSIKQHTTTDTNTIVTITSELHATTLNQSAIKSTETLSTPTTLSTTPSTQSKTTSTTTPTTITPTTTTSTTTPTTTPTTTTPTTTPTTTQITTPQTTTTTRPHTTIHHHPMYTTASPHQVHTCPNLENGDEYTQAQFLDRLTHPCRYDKLTRPGGEGGGDPIHGPANVSVQIDIRHMEATEQLQFKMHMLLQYRYRDSRLDYRLLSPGRTRIVGEDQLRAKLWVPHVLFSNERESAIMGHDARDIFMSIDPDGEVMYSRRIRATLYCWMDLKKFPFDVQDCEIVFQSWTYNASDLILRWEEQQPVVMAKQLHLTEYSMIGFWTEADVKMASRHSRAAFIGNYSTLIFKFNMQREIGFYMMDYFIPSIMLVCISWVSFWLQADASAPRIALGTSTMLSFITLATAQSRTLPKVSYIKASEIWFLGCTIFIFGSMVEFAFVNIIWRRKANVELKKVNSKYILKSTLTPKLARKELHKSNGGLHKSHSCSSLNLNNTNSESTIPQYNNYLTVHGFSGMTPPTIRTESVDDLMSADRGTDSISVGVPYNDGRTIGDKNSAQSQSGGWTTMTPQEIAQWIDRRARLVFPLAFIVFNVFYWGFVYWL